jgi:hypothetical protein
MPEYDFFSYVLSPAFLIMAGLTFATFVPVLWSIWVTWRDNGHKVEALKERQRAERAEERARRRARFRDVRQRPTTSG